VGGRSVASATVLVAILMLAVPGGVAGRGTGSTAAWQAMVTSTLTPDADTRVLEAAPTTNYGSSGWLRVDGGGHPQVQTYLRFTVSGLPAVQRATLRLYAYTGSTDGPAVFGTSTSWIEGAITWNNRPAPSTAVADKGAIAANTWVEYDVTSYVSGSGSFGFALVATSQDAVEFYSRESSQTTLRPQLVVEGTTGGSGDVVVAAAGDIASCSSNGDESTARLLDTIAPTKVLALGDTAYPDGTAADFSNCYAPTWGRHKAKTSPSVGNHEYHVPAAAGYFGYFGAAAGDPAKGYYAFDLGAWRLYALNSNCGQVACAAGSAQEQWLRADLAANPRSCIAAFMHHPRFASGPSGARRNNTSMAALYQAFYAASGDLWLVGHNHYYERLTHLSPTGAIDTARGIRNFVVGTGGSGHGSFGSPITGSEVRNSSTFGVLRLTLRAGGYDWRFVPISGQTFTDSGSDTC
jgi:calcineurin-like phosphoesterase family protein